MAPAGGLLPVLGVAAPRPRAVPSPRPHPRAAAGAAPAPAAPAGPLRAPGLARVRHRGVPEVAAVVLVVVEGAELLAVIGAAHELAPAAGVPVVAAAVPRAVAVALAVLAGLLGGAAPPPVIVPARASLT